MRPEDYQKLYWLGIPFDKPYFRKEDRVRFETLDDLLIYVWKNCPKGGSASVLGCSGTTHGGVNFNVCRGRSLLCIQSALPNYSMSYVVPSRVSHTLHLLPMSHFSIDVDDTKLQIKVDYQNKGKFIELVKNLDAAGWKK